MLALAALPAMADATLRLTTENLPPYNILGEGPQSVTGLVADKVVEMMHRAGISYTLMPSGWNRAYQMAQKRPDTCVFSTVRMTEREALFKWIGPFAVSEWQIYGRVEDHGSKRTLADIHDATISVYQNDALDISLKQRGYQVVEADSGEASLRALLAGRADYWASGNYSGPRMLRDAGATDRVRLLFTFERTELYLACNPGVADELVDRLRAAQKQLEGDGTFQRIDAKYTQ